MKAYPLKKTGKTEVLIPEDVEAPQAGPGQVRVKVKTIGVNYAEILSRRGQYSWAPKKPYIPGMEAFGKVVETGKGVTKHKPGDEVICGWQYGSYAEEMVVPEYMAFPAFPEWDAEENAAFLVNYMTAWVTLVKLGRLQKSDTVLINAAAGGVGTAAVQIAKAHDCTVIGTASRPEKLKLLEKLHVDHPINYKKEDFAKKIRKEHGGVDLVLELVGGSVYRKSFDLLRPFGRMMIGGVASLKYNKWNPFSWYGALRTAPKVKLMEMAKKSTVVGATHIGYLIDNPEVTAQCWEELTYFIRKHHIKPIVGQTFSFNQLPHAHEFIESRKSTGKVVITLD